MRLKVVLIAALGFFFFTATLGATTSAEAKLRKIEIIFHHLLEKAVKNGKAGEIQTTLVDYQVFQSPYFNTLLQRVSEFDPSWLKGDAQRLSFWINMYNLGVIRLIMQHPEVRSIREIGSLFLPVWNKPALNVGGRWLSLGEIEHDILRKMGDPRIHFAIVCASLSCPDLKPYSYKFRYIDRQLELSASSFLDNTSKGFWIDESQRRLHVSKLFKWFEDDFEPDGIVGFLEKHSRRDLDDYSINFMSYDWQLNRLK